MALRSAAASRDQRRRQPPPSPPPVLVCRCCSIGVALGVNVGVQLLIAALALCAAIVALNNVSASGAHRRPSRTHDGGEAAAANAAGDGGVAPLPTPAPPLLPQLLVGGAAPPPPLPALVVVTPAADGAGVFVAQPQLDPSASPHHDTNDVDETREQPLPQRENDEWVRAGANLALIAYVAFAAAWLLTIPALGATVRVRCAVLTIPNMLLLGVGGVLNAAALLALVLIRAGVGGGAHQRALSAALADATTMHQGVVSDTAERDDNINGNHATHNTHAAAFTCAALVFGALACACAACFHLTLAHYKWLRDGCRGGGGDIVCSTTNDGSPRGTQQFATAETAACSSGGGAMGETTTIPKL